MNSEFLNLTAANINDKLNQSCIDTFPLAMVYAPLQSWGNLYSADVGLERGTIFSELDKPFLGRRADS